MTEQHIFSFYTELPSYWQPGQIFESDNPALLHRLITVVRIEIGQEIVLFDDHQKARVNVNAFTKKKISFLLIRQEPIKVQTPSLTLVLPVLKRDALEAALYSACEMGVTSIQLVATQKSCRTVTEKEYERARLILIAAAEQSKQYAVPELKKMVAYEHFIATSKESPASLKILCDGSGESLVKLASLCAEKKSYKETPIMLLVGPEGGLTAHEIEQARSQGYVPCRLTSTTLRALQAVAVSIGILRSLE